MSSMDATINQITMAVTAIVITLSSINFVLGAVGLSFNILVFTRPSLRREPCAVFFLWSSWFNLFVIFVVVPVRIVSEGFNIDMANFNLGICKIELFTFYVVRTISCWLITLACIDRYLHSSARAHLRRISSYKTARIATVITSMVIIILHIHMLVFYEISNVYDRSGKLVPGCYGQKGVYRTFIAFWAMTLYSLCPSLLMLVFGFLTLHNLRHHRRVIPTAPQINQRARRTDIQLSRMLAIQVLVIILSTLPFSVYRLYASFTATVVKDALRLALETLVFQIAGMMTYFAHSTSFYLYTLTGTVFRKEVFKIIRRYRPLNRTVLARTHGETHQMSVLTGNQRCPISHNDGT